MHIISNCFIPTPSYLNVNLLGDRFQVSSGFLHELSFRSLLAIKKKIPWYFDRLWSCAWNNYWLYNGFHYYLVSSLIKPILIIFFFHWCFCFTYFITPSNFSFYYNFKSCIYQFTFLDIWINIVLYLFMMVNMIHYSIID